MTEEEFNLLDELYFVQHYSYLKEALVWDDQRLLATLQSLYDRDLIKCLKTPEEEFFEKIDLSASGKEFFYLATKKGLMLHNTI